MSPSQVQTSLNTHRIDEFSNSMGLKRLLDSQKIWHAQELSRDVPVGVPTGFSELDDILPNHGWPKSQLIELVQSDHASAGISTAGIGSLLIPALRDQLRHQGQLVLVNPGFELHLPGWLQSVDSCSRILQIDIDSQHPRAQARACWAVEQALHCADIAMVLAWLPSANAEALRRLQVAAAQSQALVFVIRRSPANKLSSAAPMRLSLERIDPLTSELRLLKCRGSAADAVIRIPLLNPPLRALLQAPRRRSYDRRASTTTTQKQTINRLTPRSQEVFLPGKPPLFGHERAADVPTHDELHHVLDCTTTSIPSFIATTAPPDFIRSVGKRELPERKHSRAARQARSH